MIRAVKRLLPERKVCERYGVTPVTLRRWDQDRRLNFPKAVVIRKRKYRDANELDEFDARPASFGLVSLRAIFHPI